MYTQGQSTASNFADTSLQLAKARSSRVVTATMELELAMWCHLTLAIRNAESSYSVARVRV